MNMDCVFRIAKEGLFKGQDYVELAYMTGILPIKKYGEHSAIRNSANGMMDTC